jgi:uncharacterized membrane protein
MLTRPVGGRFLAGTIAAVVTYLESEDMPYCSQCGNQVGTNDIFCSRCGTGQPVAPRPAVDPLSRLSPRVAAALCYIPVVGWIASIIVLASDRFRHDHRSRFHAFQGLYLFVAWLIVDQVIRPLFSGLPGGFFPVHKILDVILMLTWIFMLVKVSHDETYSLPIIGDLAEKSAAER